MLKHFLYIVLLSIAIVLMLPYCHQGLDAIASVHAFALDKLGIIFTGSKVALTIKQVIAILFIPAVVASIMWLINLIFKRGKPEYLVHAVWIVWLVLVTIIIIKS